MRRLGLAVVLCLAPASCSSGQELSVVVEAIGNSAIIPNLDAAVTGLENLDSAVTIYCNKPGPETLADARDAWLAAKTGWEPSQLNTYFDSGGEARTVSLVDHDPASPREIDSLLQSDVVIDSNYIAESAKPAQRGLGAMEYLLFGRADGTERSCLLLEGASIVALQAARELRDDWTNAYDGLAPFIDQYTNEKTDREALADTVDAIVDTLEKQARFGNSGSVQEALALEEGPAGAGVTTYKAQIRGIESWLLAGGEASLLELIRSRSTDVAHRIEAGLEGALAVLEDLNGPMRTVAIDDPEQLRRLHDHLAGLVALIGQDVTALLDLPISSRNTQ